MKRYLAFAVFMLAGAFCFAQGERGFFINKGQSEVNLYGGVAVSTKDSKVAGETLEYGGSGYILGVTTGIYVTEHILVGVDFSYSDNGYGNIKEISGVKYKAATEHIAPMFYAKGQLFPDSPVRVYVPMGIGADFTRVTIRQQGQDETSTTSGGIALMAGLGFEVDVARNTFIGMEGRYVYTDFFGRDTAGISSTGVFNILFKVGMRFDSSDLW